MALVGAFLPWWGFDVSGIISNQAHRWTIWNPPRLNTQVPGVASVSWNFTISSLSVLVLVLVATALVVVGSITLLRRYLLGGLVLSVLAPVVYAVAINYVTMNYCITPFCVSGPVGSESVSRAPGLGVVWGFQIGFYVFLAAVLVLIGGLVFNSRLAVGPSHIWKGEDHRPHGTYDNIVRQLWDKHAVPVKVLSQLWPSESRTSPLGIVSDLRAGCDVKCFLRIGRT
jgi:hypothetical protein